MTGPTTWRHSNQTLGLVLAVLAAFGGFFMTSDLSDPVRYSVGGAIVVALLLGAAQFGLNNRRRN